MGAGIKRCDGLHMMGGLDRYIGVTRALKGVHYAAQFEISFYLYLGVQVEVTMDLVPRFHPP
jgi:hypothetical protein